MSEWKEYKLGDVTDIIDSLHQTPKYVVSGFPMVRVTDIKSVFLQLENTLKVDEHTFKEFSKKHTPKKGDIVFSRVGSYGVSSIVNSNEKFCLGQNTVFIVPKQNPYFIYYFLNSPIAKNQIEGLVAGSTQQTISLQSINNIKVLLPPLPEQTQITEILGSLDDKIDLLYRQNKMLEQLAETLFSQRFIEEAEIQSNKQLLLGNLIDSVSITHAFPSEEVVFLNTSDIYLGEVLINKPVDINFLPGQAKKSIQKEDILFSEIRPANGRYAYINFDAENYVVSTKLMVLRSKNILSQAFIYFYLTNSKTLEWLQILAESRSGTFPQITFDQLRDLKINIPSESILKESIIWCETALEKIKSNENQIRTITQLRDTLLPKLMSGEVRVK